MATSISPILPSEVIDHLAEPTDLEKDAAIIYVNQQISSTFSNGQARVNMGAYSPAMLRALNTLYAGVSWIIAATTVQLTASSPVETYWIFTR